MKKIALLLVLTSLSLASCSSDDEQPIIETPKPITQSPLIGKWDIIEIQIYNNGEFVKSTDLKQGECNYAFYDIKVGGIYEENFYNPDKECEKSITDGTWNHDESVKKLTLNSNEIEHPVVLDEVVINETEIKGRIYSINGQTRPDDSKSDAYYILKKQK